MILLYLLYFIDKIITFLFNMFVLVYQQHIWESVCISSIQSMKFLEYSSLDRCEICLWSELVQDLNPHHLLSYMIYFPLNVSWWLFRCKPHGFFPSINLFLSNLNLGESTIKGCLEAYSCKFVVWLTAFLLIFLS